MRAPVFQRIFSFSCALVVAVVIAGCQQQKPAAPAGAGMQAMPVQTVAVTLAPVAQSSEYVATIMSRRSATMQPQVSGRLLQIHVKSGDHVNAGQPMFDIDSQPQVATVEAQRATERQKKALFDYNTVELERQRKLFEAGIISRDVWDQAQQSYSNTKADYESSVSLRKTQEEQLAYYSVRAPFDGVIGDVPVHVGDYVSTTTVLTTLDQNKDLEAYIYIPTERSSEARLGLGVELYDTGGKLLEKTKVDFVSPQVDSTLQGILVKAPVHPSAEMVRNAQLIKARVIWSTKPMAVIPVLAVTRQGGQPFVFVARQQDGHFIATQTPVVLGDTVGNTYAISSGLNAGDKVIVSSTQFLVNGMPVMPLSGAPLAAGRG
jgi:RND family efflux transporter MFP subunit